MTFSQMVQRLNRDDEGAIGWLLVGVIVGIVLVIYVAIRIIGAIF